MTFEFGFDQNLFEMNSLNRFYVDSFAAQINPALLEDGVTSGQSFRIAIQYRPVNIFDFGFFGMYQFGETSSNPQFPEIDETGMIVAHSTAHFSLRAQAISFGISTNTFLSELLGFQNKPSLFLSGSHLSIELHAGLGYSTVILDLQMPSNPTFSSFDFYNTRDFQGAAGLKYNYDITRNNLIGSVGFHIGYQFFKTGVVEDRLGNSWVIQGENPISLDFSGLYYGLILGLGK